MLVTVAPLTMSIFAFCDVIVSCTRIGSAWLLISASLGLPFGYCTTLTFVIVPPVIES